MASLPAPGYLPREMQPSLSPAAGVALAAELTQGIGHYDIAVLPRTRPNQADLPCCVSCALTAGMEAIDATVPPLSPIFHYHVTRYDNGASHAGGFIGIDEGITTLRAEGICLGDLHDQPYTVDGTTHKPSIAAYTDGRTRAWLRSNHVDTPVGPSRAAWVRRELMKDRPVVIGFRLPVTYPNGFLDQDHRWASPSQFPSGTNSHCVLSIGFNDAYGFRIQDWRGSDAFDEGCWWMGYSIVDSSVVSAIYSLFD